MPAPGTFRARVLTCLRIPETEPRPHDIASGACAPYPCRSAPLLRLGRAVPGLALVLTGLAMLILAYGQPAWLDAHVGPGLFAQLLSKGVIALGAIWAAFRALDATPAPARTLRRARRRDRATLERPGAPRRGSVVRIEPAGLRAGDFGGFCRNAGRHRRRRAQSGRARGHGVRAGCHDDGDRTYTFAAHGAALASFVKRPGHGSERMDLGICAGADAGKPHPVCRGRSGRHARRRPARHRPGGKHWRCCCR